MRVCFCGPERPGKAITVAPFRDGMNQPSSRSPSLVVKETSSCAAPRFGVGTTARAVCVTTYAIDTGKSTIAISASAPAENEPAPQVAAAAAVVGPPGPPERPDPDPEQDEAGEHGEEAGEVVAGRVGPRTCSRRPRCRRGRRRSRTGARAPRGLPPGRAGTPTRRPRRARAASARPADGRSGDMPGSGWRKLSSTTCRPTRPSDATATAPLGREARQGASRRDVRGGNGHADAGSQPPRRRGRRGAGGSGAGFLGYPGCGSPAELRSGGTSAPPARGATRCASTAAPASRRSPRRTSRRCRP